MERETLLEWQKEQSPENRIALGLDENNQLWIAERTQNGIESIRPEAESEKWSSQEVSSQGPVVLAGKIPLSVGADGLWDGDKRILDGNFHSWSAAGLGGTRLAILSGTPSGREEGTWLVRLAPDAEPDLELLSGASTGVSIVHTGKFIGVAWSDLEGVHTSAVSPEELSAEAFQKNLVSYYNSDHEIFRHPSVTVDQTGLPYVLFAVYDNTGDAPKFTRELQLNFERISFKASAGVEGEFSSLVVHRRRLYFLYCTRGNATTVRWRVPGTVIWDGAAHLDGAWPTAISDGESLYLATNSGVWVAGRGETDEGSDILNHSWASPDYEADPEKTAFKLSGRQFKIDYDAGSTGLWGKIKSWFGR